MLNFLESRLNRNKNRAPVASAGLAPALVHGWDFWHDRQDRSSGNSKDNSTTSTTPTTVDAYEERLEHLASILDVRQFWNVLNNFDISQLKLRDSIHLFHRGVKPVWEDPRNEKGGCWTFRVPKAHAAAFWQEMCMMAIGEQLQQAVEEPTRKTFRDDICGVSLGVRFNSMLIQIWNRDAAHEAGIERLKETVLWGVSPELRPKDGSYYYKKHIEHAGFGATGSSPPAGNTPMNTPMNTPNTPMPASTIIAPTIGMQSLDAVLKG
jgi:hypothetical protein